VVGLEEDHKDQCFDAHVYGRGVHVEDRNDGEAAI
jgi:hypothetical protein